MSSTNEHSADESGYITSRFRRDRTPSEEYDPSEHSYHSDDDITESSARSLTPVPPHPMPAPPAAARGLGFRALARKRVPIPVRVSFSAPTGEVGESSRARLRSVTPPSVTETSAGRSPGMTAPESRWVLGIAQDLQLCKLSMEQFHHLTEGAMAVLNSQSEVIDRSLEMAIATRRAIRRLYTYMAVLVGVLALVVGLLIGSLMR